ncbi:hypothetical protein FB45DRAFT_1067232 [Roridomyces roridus]|uniref:Uncharacterized protein n=1 Tax=Roridomyces roridus TaxID=1738132 RepID=A0AAD7B3E0_9AGAR|nr:hypothetical protein FB45DRAFT_1067232 [Roridomyces roridus]
MAAVHNTISSQVLEYAIQPQFALPPAEPFENEETWVTAKSQISEMRDALECTGTGVLTFALSRAIVEACRGLDNGLDGGIHNTLIGVLFKEPVLKAVLSKIHHAGVNIDIPKHYDAKRAFLQLVGALWTDVNGPDRLIPWLMALFTPLIQVGMRARGEYYDSVILDKAKVEREKKKQIAQDMVFFNAYEEMFMAHIMFHKGKSAPPHNAAAVVPLPAKIDDGVSMKSLGEALDADGGFADYVSETDSDMEDFSVSGLDATNETSSVASTAESQYTLPLSALDAALETASVSSSMVQSFLDTCLPVTPTVERQVKKMREAEDDGCLADVSNAESDEDDATSTATATPTRPRSKAVNLSPGADAHHSPWRAPLTARNLYLLEEEPLLRKDRAPSVISDSFFKTFGPFEEGFILFTEEEAYGLASSSAAVPGLEPAAEISEDDQASSPPRFTKKRRISPNDSQSAYSRGSSISYQATPPRPRW